MLNTILFQLLVTQNCLSFYYSTDITEIVNEDTSVYKYRNYQLSEIEKKVKIYSDSLNDCLKLEDCPDFIFNPKFDIQFANLWPSDAYPICMRKLVLDQVTNLDLLNEILQAHQRRLNKKFVSKYYTIPYCQFTWHDLIILRRDELLSAINYKKYKPVE